MLDTLWLQKDLNFLGYNAGAEDNIYGSQTKKAVTNFQKDFKGCCNHHSYCCCSSRYLPCSFKDYRKEKDQERR